MSKNQIHLTTLTATDMDWKYYYNNENGGDLKEEGIGKAVVLSITTIICLFGLFANGMILYYLGFRIRRSPFTTYILNLAVADFSFLLIFSFTLAFLKFHGDVTIGMSQMSDLLEPFVMFGYVASQYFLTSISVERSLSVLCPIWYQCSRSKKQSLVVCTVLWALAGTALVAQYISCIRYRNCKEISAIQAGMSFLIFIPLLVVSNITLVGKICRHSQRQHPPRLYILIITTVLAFLLLSVPLSLYIILDQFDITLAGYTVTAIVSPIVNSSLDPVIYFLVGSLRQRQRKFSIISSLRRVFHDESEASQQ